MQRTPRAYRVGRGRRTTKDDLAFGIPAEGHAEFAKLASLLEGREAAYHLMNVGVLARALKFSRANERERGYTRDARLRVFITAHLSLKGTKSGVRRRMWKTLLENMAFFGIDWDAVSLANRYKLNRDKFNYEVLFTLCRMVTELERSNPGR